MGRSCLKRGWLVAIILLASPGPAAVAQDCFHGGHGSHSPRAHTMRPGEVQRWCFINATLSSLSQVNVQLPSGAVVKQIAMDGVRFTQESYARQPLFDPSPSDIKPAPGNRADFLVQAPGEHGEHPEQ